MTVYSNSTDLRKNSDPSSLSATYSFYHSLNNSSNSNNLFSVQAFKHELSTEDCHSQIILNRASLPPQFDKYNKRRLSRQSRRSPKFQLLCQRKLLSRCLSVPATSLFEENKSRSIRNDLLIEESPTIKFLCKNSSRKRSSKRLSNGRMKQGSLSSLLVNKNLARSNCFELSKNRSHSRNLFEDTSDARLRKNYEIVNNFSFLAFKRSFSYMDLVSEQKYIKKSSSFEKFLQNVIKGEAALII